jgi:hypothetical protein
VTRDGGLVIVSAADTGYFPLLQDAVASVRALNREVAIGVLDLGLAEGERAWLAEHAAQVVSRAGTSISPVRTARRRR